MRGSGRWLGIGRLAGPGAALLLSACGGAVIPPAVSTAPAPRYTPATPRPAVALTPQQQASGVIGVDARALTRMFGEPRLDIRDPAARKLQFGDGRCILDTYLYGTSTRSEPVVAHAEARGADGADMDWVACASQLRAR